VLNESSIIKPTKPQYHHWMNIALGRSGFGLSAVASAWDSETQSYASNELRAEVVISHTNSKTYFSILELHKAEIEVEFGESLIWYSNPEARSCRIFIRRSTNLNARDNWSEQHKWLRDKLDKLHKVFSTRVKQLSLDESVASSSSEPA
jgi:hypothetical protein